MDIANLTTYSLFALSVVLCVYILWFYKQTFAYWRKRGLIYLEPTIPFGNAYDACLKKHTFGELFAQFYLKLKERGVKHGGAYIFWKPVYIPVDSEIIRNILIRDSEYFPNHGMYINEKNDPLSGHIFNMENVEWRNFRSKMPSVFTSAKMRKMFLIMEGMTKRFNSNLNAYAKSGHAVDIKKETTKFTTDIIAACAFGIESNTMKNENEEMLKQARGFFDYQWNYIRNTLVMTLPRPFLKKINFRIMPKGLERYFRDLCEKIINHRKESHLDRGDLADTLMRLMQKRETDFTGKDTMEPLNFEQFMAQACVFFSAGFETSSSTQTFAMYELAKDLDCQVKLRKEIDKVLEKYDNKVTYEAVMEMKYLDCVVDETLRLYPVFPILPRVCVKDYAVPGTDFTIEKDTFVMVSNMGIQRDPEYYPNPDKFDPERFFRENKSLRPFIAHIPFGEGPRICLGKRFGLLQTKLGLLTVVRNYDISLNEDKTSPSMKFVAEELILRKTGDVWINLKRRTT